MSTNHVDHTKPSEQEFDQDLREITGENALDGITGGLALTNATQTTLKTIKKTPQALKATQTVVFKHEIPKFTKPIPLTLFTGKPHLDLNFPPPPPKPLPDLNFPLPF